MRHFSLFAATFIICLPLLSLVSPQHLQADEDTAASVAHAHTLSRAFRQAADQATPAVVAISVKIAPVVAGHPTTDEMSNLPPEIKRFLD